MKSSKLRINLLSFLLCLILVSGTVIHKTWFAKDVNENRHITVGFVFDGDESAPYSYNFIRAIHQIESQYGDKVTVIPVRNITEDHIAEALDTLAEQKCDLIVTTSYGYAAYTKEFAGEHPEIEFIEATGDNANTDPVYDNYHTFMGEIYQGRYVAGIAAGMKLEEMIQNGIISPEEAVIGYVAAFPVAEVISGYTAFFLGIRSRVPTATMKVCYTNSWSDYVMEKEYTEKLIADGCVIISQHSDTIGPAVACEEADEPHPVYHVGYNQSMMDVAPTTSLISTRINWTPYILGAVDAVLKQKKIEDHVSGTVRGNDMSASFNKNWVQMVELNTIIATKGTQEEIDQAIRSFKNGKVHVFKGDYIGVNPDDPNDIWDLNTEFKENKNASSPSFHYVLKDVIEIVDYSEAE